MKQRIAFTAPSCFKQENSPAEHTPRSVFQDGQRSPHSCRTQRAQKTKGLTQIPTLGFIFFHPFPKGFHISLAVLVLYRPWCHLIALGGKHHPIRSALPGTTTHLMILSYRRWLLTRAITLSRTDFHRNQQQHPPKVQINPQLQKGFGQGSTVISLAATNTIAFALISCPN